MVDYVYILDSLENVFKVVCFFIFGCLICIFGCGGDWDCIKWFLMGNIVV